ncbi:hypothetical protein DBR11_22775 [Pedobacter sp. HMWF019]|jgi:hypothetical protein|uniref:hypothetical protein n=1 Tax=Pedobacter sp. HMWF019 TaxID=2056856 RepID=UPI000D35345D|nr:hypothetical protein [Pedobacter sp. HMWF019]PTS94652.1 hypothetical protein DBR11_22775 [Pedobacter sp. HMWF019]
MARLFVYTKDVQVLTGKGRTAAQKLVAAIKAKLNKNRNDNLTVEEFCRYTGLTLGLVLEQLE